jgi:acetyl-CoA C-acetyltransferase
VYPTKHLNQNAFTDPKFDISSHRMKGGKMTRVFIASAARTPIGSFSGSLSKLNSVQLGVTAATEAIKRAGLEDKKDIFNEVIMGCVLQAGQGQGVARQVAIGSGLPVSVPAYTTNIICGSGLFSVIQATRNIRAGEGSAYLCGGTESMSNAPYLLPKARDGYRMGNGEIVDSMVNDGLFEVFNQYHMGVTAENIAEKFNITREEQDQFAYESQMKAKSAMENGKFKEEITPVTIKGRKGDTVVDVDEYPKGDTTIEKLAKLRPAFKKDGTVTAGNASGINDGAAALVVVDEATMKSLNMEPLAEITGWGVSGVEPEIMGVGPIKAVQIALQKSGSSISDLELIEANEAFAVQAIAVNRELGWNPEIINVNGGAIAMGHPIGASGARILTTLLYEMKRQNRKKGMATLCVGGGMGVALQVERP